MTNITNPFPYFPEAGTGGFIYIGAANQDARTNPITVYRDEALTLPWAQPIRTVNGYPAYQGAQSNIYTSANIFSMTVLNSRGAVVINDTQASSLGGSGAMAIGLFVDADTMILPVGTDLVQTSGYNTAGLGFALYQYDAAVNAAYVSARPYVSFLSANGRGFRLAEDMVSPDHCGAVGGGNKVTGDDTDEVWAAQDYCFEYGKTFILPQGRNYVIQEYRIISGKTNVRMIGYGGSLVYGETLRTKYIGGIQEHIPLLWFDACTDVRLDGLEFVGSGRNVFDGRNVGLHFSAVNDANTSATTPITTGIFVENCTFSNFDYGGLDLYSGSSVTGSSVQRTTNIQVTGNYFIDCNIGVFTYSAGIANLVVSNNTFYRGRLACVKVDGQSKADSPGLAQTTYNRNIVITNNNFHDINPAYLVSDPTNAILQGCIVVEEMTAGVCIEANNFDKIVGNAGCLLLRFSNGQTDRPLGPISFLNNVINDCTLSLGTGALIRLSNSGTTATSPVGTFRAAGNMLLSNFLGDFLTQSTDIVMQSVVVEDNVLDGSIYVLYGGGTAAATNVAIRRNTLAKARNVIRVTSNTASIDSFIVDDNNFRSHLSGVFISGTLTVSRIAVRRNIFGTRAAEAGESATGVPFVYVASGVVGNTFDVCDNIFRPEDAGISNRDVVFLAAPASGVVRVDRNHFGSGYYRPIRVDTPGTGGTFFAGDNDFTNVGFCSLDATSGAILGRNNLQIGANGSFGAVVRGSTNYFETLTRDPDGRLVVYGTAIPTVGTWVRGSRVLNVAPSAGGTAEWVCTASGTPGTWKAGANIAV
jgi:hypothetical protein